MAASRLFTAANKVLEIKARKNSDGGSSNKINNCGKSNLRKEASPQMPPKHITDIAVLLKAINDSNKRFELFADE